jgi:hypothetical protein
MKKTFLTAFAALTVGFVGMGTSFASTTAECLGINNQDDQTGTCLNYLYSEFGQQRSPEINIDDITFAAGIVYVDVCSDMTYFDDTLYLELEIPSAQRYWKKITEDTFKADECQTMEFRIVDTLAPRNYLLTAKVTTNLPHIPSLPQDEITRSSKWLYMAAPLRTYSGKRRDSYPVYANERRSKLFPYQQSETHLRDNVFYPENLILHTPKYTTRGKMIHMYKDKFYPTFQANWNAMSASYYYVP